MNKHSKIFVAGHRGLAGSAICGALESNGYDQILTRNRQDLDLSDGAAVLDFLKTEQPEIVVLAAAKVGGIHANSTYSAQFIYENLQIQNHVIHGSYLVGVQKLLFLGSSCIYPKYAPQPLKEEYLLSGLLEPSNESYAIAKIAGIEMCRAYRRQYGCNFICAMPTNLYGPRDNFHLENAHVLPALMHRFHLAKVEGASSVSLWGTGKPYREFLFSEDLGSACVYLLENYSEQDIVNVGTGLDVSIRELAEMMKDVVGFKGVLAWDPTKLDGTPRKLLDVGKIKEMGWQAKVPLRDGLEQTYQWFLAHQDGMRQ
jgi:GDP-L-fucose synthase